VRRLRSMPYVTEMRYGRRPSTTPPVPFTHARQPSTTNGSTPADGARYRLLFEYADDAIVCTDLEGYIVDANPATERLTGYSLSELIGQRARDRLVAPEWREVAKARLARRLEELTPHQRYEVVMVDRAGIRKPIETSSTLVYEDGTLVGIAAIFRDVTERKRTESELRESEERFRQAFEHAGIGMGVCAPSGHWLQVNQALCGLTGYSREELLEMSFQDVTHPDDLELDLDYVRQLSAGEIDSFTMEKRYIRKDGSVKWIQVTSALVHDAEGTPVYALRQMQDINDRKQAESDRQEAEERYTLAARLSDRERETLALTADGNTNEQIGAQLQISAETVQTYVRRAMKKLDARTRTQAVAKAIRLGIV
jgi:two-component system, NarL family, sensor histidine kinase UhpB